jgi:L-arabinonolactonase
VSAPLLVAATANELGECPVWCERAQALYWTDIQGSVLLRMQADGVLCRWPLPDRLGSFALCASGTQLLLGLAGGIALFDLASGEAGPVIPVEADQPTTRINDGRCDRQGRFVFGMFNPAEAPIGRFYRVHHDLRIETLPLPPAGVGNSIAFSPDGGTMYYADSPARTIWRVAYGADGSLGEPQVFHRLREDEGYPDGSCMDAEGGLWNAQWEGRCVVRYGPDGRETVRFALPVTRPTCPAFGGPDFDQLYVTSARIGLDAAALAAQPAAGGILRLPVGWRGLPESRFGAAGAR